MRAVVLALLGLLPAVALAQAPPSMFPARTPALSDRVTERIGAQLGALMIENAGLRAQVDDLQAQIEAMRRRETEKKEPPK